MAKKAEKNDDKQQVIDELTLDVQRLRADFENYRKRADNEKTSARDAGRTATILKLIPVIDNIERAISHAPEDIKEHAWVKGVISLSKQLDKNLNSLGVSRIDATNGTEFNPEHHDAIQFDEDAEGDKEVIAEELQSGYLLDGMVIRPAMVKVTRQ